LIGGGWSGTCSCLIDSDGWLTLVCVGYRDTMNSVLNVTGHAKFVKGWLENLEAEEREEDGKDKLEVGLGGGLGAVE
jgi:hypothetical protein